MERKNQSQQDISIICNFPIWHSIEYTRSQALWMRSISILVIFTIGLTSITSCKKDDKKNDEEYSYGTVELLKMGGQSPLWSPGGEKIAYLEDEKLYVMNTDGSGIHLLASQINESIKWSPTSAELAYYTYRDGPLAIYKIDVSGNNEIKLTTSGLSIMDNSISFSADGEKIAYGVSGTDKIDLYIMNNDGSGNHKLDIPITVFSPSFTPGGSRIMFTSLVDENTKRALFLVGTDGSNLQRLQIPNIIDFRNARMNSNESKIYFSGIDKVGSNWEIYEVNLDGTDLKKLTNEIGGNEPNISPDGKYIVFLGYMNEIDGVFLMHADGSNPARISKGAYRGFTGSWSPDSRKCVFDDEADGIKGIYVLNMK